MPTSLERGVVTLLRDYEVCKEGQVLTPEQAKILELLDLRLATFKLKLKAVYSKKDGFEKLSIGNDDEDDDDADMEDEEVEKPLKGRKAKAAKKAKKEETKVEENDDEEMEEDDD